MRAQTWAPGPSDAEDAAAGEGAPEAATPDTAASGSELFVIGAARSGTTIMGDILNSSDDICLLSEANLHYSWEMPAFVYSFNNQHRNGGRLTSRSSYLPKSWIGLTAHETLDELRKSFRIVGSKTAFPPFRDMPDSWAQDDTLNFHMQHFYGSRYFLTLRDPVTCCLSAAKLFPATAPNDLLANWLRSLAFLVLSAQTFPRHWIVPMAWIDANLFNQIETLLQVRLRANANWLEEPKTGRATANFGPGAAFADSLVLTPSSTMTGTQVLESAADLYARVLGWIDRDSLRFRLTGTSVVAIEHGVMGTVRQLMSGLAGTEPVAHNFLAAPDNLLSQVWQRSALSVERAAETDIATSSSFVLREQNNTQHKNIMQDVRLAVNQPVTFSGEFRPEGRSRCALQIGYSGSPSVALFDIGTHSVIYIQQGSGILTLDAKCSPTDGDWVLCSFHFMPTIVTDHFQIGLYIIDGDCRVEYMGYEDRGLSVRNIRIETINWPIL